MMCNCNGSTRIEFQELGAGGMSLKQTVALGLVRDIRWNRKINLKCRQVRYKNP